MQINEDRPHEKRKSVLSELACKRVHHQHLHFGRDSKASFIVEERTASGVRGWRLLAQRSWRQLTGSRPSYGTGWRCIFGFLRVILNWRWGQKLEKLSVFNRVLAILSLLLQIIVYLPGSLLVVAT